MTIEVESEEKNSTIRKTPLEILDIYYIKLKGIALSKYPVQFEKIKSRVKKIDFRLYILLSFLAVILLSYPYALSTQKDESVSLPDFVVAVFSIFSAIGSLLAGLGTIFAAWLAFSIRNEWKEKKFAESTYPALLNLKEFIKYDVREAFVTQNYTEDTIDRLFNSFTFHFQLFCYGEFDDKHVAHFNILYDRIKNTQLDLENVRKHINTHAFLTKNKNIQESIKSIDNAILNINFIIPRNNITKLRLTPYQASPEHGVVWNHSPTEEYVSKETITENAKFYNDEVKTLSERLDHLYLEINKLLDEL